jgi:hypothetical protein
MRKNLIMVSVFCLMLTLVCSLSATAKNNNIEWGMTMEEVKFIEDSTFVSKNNEYLNFKTDKYITTANVGYKFENNQLILCTYNFDTWYFEDNYNLYLSNYKMIESLITQEYGVPYAKQVCIWSNNKYKNDNNYLPLAVAMGHVTISSLWETEDSIIFLTMYKHCGKIVTALMFKPIQ